MSHSPFLAKLFGVSGIEVIDGLGVGLGAGEFVNAGVFIFADTHREHINLALFFHPDDFDNLTAAESVIIVATTLISFNPCCRVTVWSNSKLEVCSVPGLIRPAHQFYR